MVVLMLAMASPLAAQRGGIRPKPCGAVAYRAAEASVGAPATSFSAAATVDVEIEVSLYAGVAGLPSSFSGPHELVVRVLTPGGSLYQELTVPFTNDAVAEGATRPVQGYPRPLEVQRARKAKGPGNKRLAVVTTRLPVGGTAISTSGLYGVWRLEVVVDGIEYDCIKERTFTLTQ